MFNLLRNTLFHDVFLYLWLWKPIIIPGLAKSLKIEEVTRVEFERQLEAIKGTDVFTDDSQGSDLEELEELPLSSIRHVELTQDPVM